VLTETIQPGVLIDGQTVHPPGWMYVLAFALRGIPWAVQEATKPGFEPQVRQYLQDQRNSQTLAEIDSLLARVAELRKELL
jgi:hypothetical protein